MQFKVVKKRETVEGKIQKKDSTLKIHELGVITMKIRRNARIN